MKDTYNQNQTHSAPRETRPPFLGQPSTNEGGAPSERSALSNILIVGIVVATIGIVMVLALFI